MKKGSSTSRNPVLLFVLLCCFPNAFLAQTTAISGTVNTYGAVSFVDTTANTVTLTDPSFAASLGLNDLVLIYQTQGATIQTGANNASFGTITSLNGAGSYQFMMVPVSVGFLNHSLSKLPSFFELSPCLRRQYVSCRPSFHHCSVVLPT